MQHLQQSKLEASAGSSVVCILHGLPVCMCGFALTLVSSHGTKTCSKVSWKLYCELSIGVNERGNGVMDWVYFSYTLPHVRWRERPADACDPSVYGAGMKVNE